MQFGLKRKEAVGEGADRDTRGARAPRNKKLRRRGLGLLLPAYQVEVADPDVAEAHGVGVVVLQLDKDFRGMLPVF